MKNWEFLNLLGEIDEKYIEEAAGERKRKRFFPGIIRLSAIAACLVVFAGSVLISRHMMTEKDTAQISRIAAGAPTPGGRKILNYRGYRYEFLGDGAEYDLSGLKLTRELGKIQGDASDPDTEDQGLTATFAIGGIIYELPTYSAGFRVAVSYDGATYIAQLAGKTDNTPLDIGYYLGESGLDDRVKKAIIYDHMGLEALQELPGDNAGKILDCLKDAWPAELTEKTFSAIADAQTGGGSFLLSFLLDDSTSVEMYVIPALGYISVGDDFYQLPAQFGTTCTSMFEGLEQGPLPLG